QTIPRIYELSDRGAAYETALDAAGQALLAGGIAALPAEGLYGLHVDGARPVALERLRRLKGSPPERAFIVLLGSPEQIPLFAAELPGRAGELVQEAWPGPLTLVLPAAGWVPPELCREGRVALRCPASRLLRDLALLLPGFLVSTSANQAGFPAPKRIQEIAEEILEECAVAVDGGVLPGEGSTLVRPEADGRLTILRQGLWRS
ncbi:MAG: L-threonylcarbamoyladenylate synthase, partial [Candidatus Eisenbacteria bacterium]